MKLQGIIVIILLLNSFSINGQNAKIKIIQKNCQNDENDRRERYLKLIKGTEIIRDSIERKDEMFVIKNLVKGSYKIEFTNIFGQRVRKEVVAKKLRNKIEICTDNFEDNKEITFIQKISNKNRLQLNFMSFGCEHWVSEKVIFFQIEDDFFGEFIKDEQPPIKKKLSKEQLNYLILFERKLRQIENSMGGCTIEDSYHLILGNEELKMVDESCDWNGFYEMKKKIFELE
jgi:hypothetical protein